MPFIHITTNAKIASLDADADAMLSAVSKCLSDTVEIPEQYVMVKLDFDQKMQFAASKEPCAFVILRIKGHVDAAQNAKTIAVLTELVGKELGISDQRVLICLKDIPGENWGILGKMLG